MGLRIKSGPPAGRPRVHLRVVGHRCVYSAPSPSPPPPFVHEGQGEPPASVPSCRAPHDHLVTDQIVQEVAARLNRVVLIKVAMREVDDVHDQAIVSVVFDRYLPYAACWTPYSHDTPRCLVELGIEMRKSVCHALAQPLAQITLHGGRVSAGLKGHSRTLAQTKRTTAVALRRVFARRESNPRRPPWRPFYPRRFSGL